MWESVGLLRDGEALSKAAVTLDQWRHTLDSADAALGDESASRMANLTTVGSLIARAALRRTESRGAHFRADFPAKDDLHWKIHVAESR
jgi:L-aspartate oxidase